MPSPRVATGFGSTPFDRLDSVYSVVLKDSFVCAKPLAAITTSGALVSELPWTITDEVGAATADVEVLAGEANHPGIIRLNVGATTPADGDLVSMVPGLNDDVYLPDSNGLYMAAILRVPDVSDTKVFFGLTIDPAGAVNGSETDAVGFVFDPEDADNTNDTLWFAQVNDASTDVEEVLDKVPYVEDDWVLLELVANSTGGTFRITTEDNEQTVRVAGSITATMTPAFKVENVGAAEEAIEIDTFVLRYNLPNDVTEYLGA